ncbi:5-hydroxytryptamine receptor 2A [Stylophora pistillata]|uniref:5-hydroxytryptamine receptor 2A n=1 Tax=Stylophora pistillata TaxID=50429 RepID=A0A2B4SLK7_STYPI|nr:5-hydroxytryptamine receptor 2A [Stylophora pistillata]
MNDLRIGNTTSPPNVYAGDSLMEKSFKCLAYGVVVALSVIGNTLIIFAFKLNIGGKLHTVNNMFIVSMAAGDLLLTVASTPERITRILADERWLIHGNWGIFLCKTTNYMEKLCMNLSVIHLTLIAIDRSLYIQPEPKPKPIYDIRRGLRDCDEADKTKVECISIQNLQ